MAKETREIPIGDVQNFAKLVADGKESEVHNWLWRNAQNPDIRYCLFTKVFFKDFAGREFFCSALMYAFWMQDVDMLKLMLDEWLFDKSAPMWTTGVNAPRLRPKKDILERSAIVWEQYNEVLKGLNYTITRTNNQGVSRIVKVNGESHFDSRGIEFCPMDGDKTEKGKIYVRIEASTLFYRLIGLSGETVTDEIPLEVLDCSLDLILSMQQLAPYISRILKITSERDHTHPQALMSSLETYIYGRMNEWSEEVLKQQWCFNVGGAEREATSVLAGRVCRFSSEYKQRPEDQVNFNYRRLVFNNDNNDVAWFPLPDGLGRDFAVYPAAGPVSGVFRWCFQARSQASVGIGAAHHFLENLSQWSDKITQYFTGLEEMLRVNLNSYCDTLKPQKDNFREAASKIQFWYRNHLKEKKSSDLKATEQSVKEKMM